jgi:choline monooxygenase
MTQENIAVYPPDLTLVECPETSQRAEVDIESAVVHLDDYRQLGLPAEAYTSERYLQRERETVFSQYWVFVGLASDVPNPGDVLPLEVAGMPIACWCAIARARCGLSTTFAAIGVCSWCSLPAMCRAICAVPITPGLINWTVTLKSTPHFGGYYKDTHDGFDRDSKGLQPIRCEQWLDLVFVNLSGEAPPLEEYLHPVIDRWAAYDLDQLRREPREIGLTCNANWKLAIENFSESYHLTWVHPALNSCSRMEDHFRFEVGDVHVGQGSLLYKSGAIEGRSLPPFPNLA